MPAPGETLLSADGTLRVEFTAFEPRMSHWIYSPIVTHVPTGDVLLDLDGSLWDAVGSFDDRNRLTLEMRRYPGHEPGQTAVIDFDTGKVTIRPDEPAAKPGETTLSHFQHTYGADPAQLALARGRFILVKPFPLRRPVFAVQPLASLNVPGPEPRGVPEPAREPPPASLRPLPPTPALHTPPPAPVVPLPSGATKPSKGLTRWAAIVPILICTGIEYGGAWALVAWTPIGRLSPWFAWPLSLLLVAFLLVLSPWLFLIVAFNLHALTRKK